VLVSGSGTNLQALIDASRDPGFGARMVLVLSDRPGVRALERARQAGIPATVVGWSGDREAFTAEVCDAAEAAGAEAMVLAGFMRILSPAAVQRFPDRILNVHPSLLPAFPGADAVPQALAHAVKLTGVTVHFVDAEVDHGPVIAQEAVPVLPDDDEGALHARIQQVEHRLYPAVVAAFARGAIRVEGRRVLWDRP
jgi:phosphoribosylglycinamide formyltransferase-1